MMIKLREARMEDAQRVLEVSQDPDVMKYYGQAPYDTLEEALEEVEWFLDLRKTRNGFRYVIVNENDEYIGNIGVFDYNQEHNRAELGFLLDKAYWNQGIISKLIPQVIDECFNQYYMNRVYAYVDPLNVGSQRVLEKSGFTEEGLLKAYDYEPGRGYVDVKLYAIINPEK